MKQLPVAGKALTVIFAVIWMIGCSSTDTSEMDAAAEADSRRAAESAAAAAERAKADAAAQAAAAARAAQRALEDAVAAAGNVVYFEFDSSTLSSATRAALDAHIALAKTNTGSMRLEGHCDERGTREYNIALGERRAKAVADYMAVNGIARYRLETISFGEEKPMSMGSGESNWSKNRRVEIR